MNFSPGATGLYRRDGTGVVTEYLSAAISVPLFYRILQSSFYSDLMRSLDCHCIMQPVVCEGLAHSQSSFSVPIFTQGLLTHSGFLDRPVDTCILDPVKCSTIDGQYPNVSQALPVLGQFSLHQCAADVFASEVYPSYSYLYGGGTQGSLLW